MDNFSIGFTYGLRKLQKPLKSIVIFGLCYGIEAFMLGVALSLDAFGVGIGGAG
jgi:putative Mn2+ efflux pump MntP